jgi:toxin ParE1/3/4
MARVVWSERALRDLRRISDYLAKDSVKNARRVANAIRAATKQLRSHPRLGAMVPEHEVEHLREFLVFSYRVIYRLKGNDCEIAAIFHGSQDLERHYDLP